MTEENKSPDNPSEGEASAAAEPSVEDLHLLLEDARAKVDQHWDQLVRLQAELENSRRRAERDVESAHRYALDRFALELLPVRDSLELGLAAASGDEPSLARLREGTEMTLKLLTGAMEKFGICEVDPRGQPFNPEFHQAMSLQPTAEQPANTVVAVMQKGYTLNDRLIRPAMVVVAKAP